MNQSLKSVDDAPFELFQNGAEFEFREGSKLVATGKICTEYKLLKQQKSMILPSLSATNIGDKTVIFVSGEFSNSVYVFYVKE